MNKFFNFITDKIRALLSYVKYHIYISLNPELNTNNYNKIINGIQDDDLVSLYNQEEKIQKQRLLFNIICGSAAIITLGMIISCFVRQYNIIRWVLIAGAYDIVSLILLLLNKRGKFVLASSIYVCFLVFLVFVLSLSAGGIQAGAVQILPVIVMISGLLLGWRTGLITGLLVALGSLGLVFIEIAGKLPVDLVQINSLGKWVNLNINIGMLVLIQYLAVSSLVKSYTKAKNELIIRIRLQKDLIKSESFRKQVFESSRVAIVIMEADSHKYIDCNQAAADIYNYPSINNIIGKKPIDFSSPFQYDGTQSEVKAEFYINKAVNDGSVVFEWKHMRPDGEYWDAEVHLMSFEIDNKKLLQFTLNDITNRKASELLLLKQKEDIEVQNEEYEQLNEELNQINQELLSAKEIAEENEIKFRTMFENSKDAINVSVYGKQKFANPAFFKLFGYTNFDEYFEHSVLDHIAPSHHNQINEFIKNRSNGESVPSYYETRGRKLDGTEFDEEVSISTYNLNGEIHSVAIIRDITQRKEADKNIRESEERYRSLYNDVPAGLYRTSSDGKVQDTNFASVKMYGYDTREELMTIKSSELWVNPDQRIPLTLLTPSNPNYDLECQMYKKDKSVIWVRNKGHAVFDNNGRIIYYEGSNEDITELKYAENLLNKEKVFNEAIMNSVPGLLYMYSKGGKLIRWNNQHEIITGYSTEELSEMNVSGWFERGDPQMAVIEEKMKDVFTSGHAEVEAVLRIKNGQNIPFYLTGVSVCIEGEQYLIGMGIDITERKKMERDLKESEERFKEMADLLPQVIFECDINWKLIYVNSVAYELFGYSREDYNSDLDITNMIIPEERQFALERMDKLFKEHKPQHSEYTALRKDGSTFPVIIYSDAITRNNKPIGMRGLIFDVTEIRMVEKAINDSEERYRIVTNLSGNMIFEHLIQDNYVIWDGAMEAITGYKPEEYKFKTYASWVEIIHPDDKEKTVKLFEDSISYSIPYHTEYRIQNKNKDYIWIESEAFIIKNQNNEVIKVLGVMKNITNQKILESQILNSVIETEERERLNFSQELHDSLGPQLSATKMYVQWLARPNAKVNQSEVLSKVENLLDESLTIIRDISFKLNPHILQNFGLEEALKAFCEKLKESSNIIINFNTSNLYRLSFKVETIVYRVLCECLNNTIKHANASKINMEIYCLNNMLIVEYSDNGTGFHIDQVMASHKGIGLLNMQSRIKSINGILEINTNPGGGTFLKSQINIKNN